MRFLIPILLSLVSFYSQLSQARPKAWISVDPFSSRAEYTKTEQRKIPGKPIQIPLGCTPSGGLACTFGTPASYKVGITVVYGLNLALDLTKIGLLGSDVNVSKTDTTGQANTAGVDCNGLWTCEILVKPTMVEISGTKNSFPPPPRRTGGGWIREIFVVQYPKLGQDGNSVSTVEACACPNRPHGSDEGAPPPCPEACVVAERESPVVIAPPTIPVTQRFGDTERESPAAIIAAPPTIPVTQRFGDTERESPAAIIAAPVTIPVTQRFGDSRRRRRRRRRSVEIESEDE